MKTSDFYYDLPERLIAQVPTKDRLASRLLVLDKKTGKVIDGHFPDIRKYLHKGDVLVTPVLFQQDFWAFALIHKALSSSFF